MSMSRRSFLKLAGLTTVAAVGASMFTGCSVAAVIQVTNTKGDIFPLDNEDAQAQLKQVNGILKFMPIPFVSKVKVADIEKNLQDALNKSNADLNGKKLVITNADEEGYIVATGDFIGTLTIDIALADATSAQAATFSL